MSARQGKDTDWSRGVVVTCARRQVTDCDGDIRRWHDLFGAVPGASPLVTADDLRRTRVLVLLPPNPLEDEQPANLDPFPPVLVDALERGLVIVSLVPSWGTPAPSLGSDEDSREWARALVRALTGYEVIDRPVSAVSHLRQFRRQNPLLLPGLAWGGDAATGPDALDPSLEIVLPDPRAVTASTVFWRDARSPGVRSSAWFERQRGRVEVLLFRQESEAEAVRAALRVGELARDHIGNHEMDLEPPPWRYPQRLTRTSTCSYTIDFSDGASSMVFTSSDVRAAVRRASVVVDLAGALALDRGHIIAVERGGDLVPAPIARQRTERPVAWLLAGWTLLRGEAVTQVELRGRVWLHALMNGRGLSHTEATERELAVGTLRGYLSSVRRHVSPRLVQDGKDASGARTHRLAEIVALVRRVTAHT